MRVCKVSPPNLRSVAGARQEVDDGVRVLLRERYQGEMTDDWSPGLGVHREAEGTEVVDHHSLP